MRIACAVCRKKKSESGFYKINRRTCKKYIIVRSGKWAKSNPEKNRAKALKYIRKIRAKVPPLPTIKE